MPTASLKRHPALVPLSRDHHFALMHALALRRSAQAPARGGPGAVTTAEAFLAFYREELTGHMADEEEALLPIAGSVSPEDTRRLLDEHEDLRERVAELTQLLLDGTDPRSTMQEIGERLHDHVRFEERVFFETVQARLSPEALAGVGLAIAAHRKARGRGPACPLPPPGINPGK